MTERRSLLFKYFSICTAVILISFICLGAVLLLISSRYFTDLSKTNLESAAYELSQQLSAIMTDDPSGWRSRAESEIEGYSDEEQADILIISSDGSIVLSTLSDALSDELVSISDETVLDSEFMLQYNSEPSIVYTDFGGNASQSVMTVGVIFSGNGPVYLLTLVPSQSSIKGYTTVIMEIFAISAFIVLIISAVIMYFTAVRLASPIEEMAMVARRIGSGNFDVSLPEYTEREFNDLAAAISDMASSLKSYDTMRNSFIANVSHELRTPMTSISGFVDGFLDGTIPEDEKEHYLKIISSEVHRLTRLVRSMLNLAKIEAGELKPNMTSFSVLDPIVDTLVTFEKRIEEKNIEVTGLNTEKRYYLWADSDLIHQVIYNLLENAIKFVDVGGRISFRFEEAGYLTVIHIRNSGEGLSQEELSLVFERFYKTDKSRSIDSSGVGLGLNIVRSIIKLHGGKIQVRSVQGEYTEFMFSLPNKDIS